MKKIIFYQPISNLKKSNYNSGTLIRPKKMKKAFVSIGYEVIDINGNFNNRNKMVSDALKDNITFAYFESNNTPLFLTCRNEKKIDFVSDIKDMVSIIANCISTIFNAIIDLGTENGAFTITTLVRRLIIPDDLSVFRSNLNGLMETLQNTYGTEIIGYLNQLKNLFNASSTNLVPEFIVPAFSIGGAQIPETVISFALFVPFMPYLHSVMSAFMWLAFILFIIKDFPNFLSGFFSTADHEISAEHNVDYYRSHGGF